MSDHLGGLLDPGEHVQHRGAVELVIVVLHCVEPEHPQLEVVVAARREPGRTWRTTRWMPVVTPSRSRSERSTYTVVAELM